MIIEDLYDEIYEKVNQLKKEKNLNRETDKIYADDIVAECEDWLRKLIEELDELLWEWEKADY